MLIDDVVAEGAAAHPDRAALVVGDRRSSYGDLDRLVEAEAARIASATEPGDRVAVLSDNTLGYVTWYYAAPRAGRVLTPLNQRLHPAEVAEQVDRAGATVVAGPPRLVDPVRRRGGAPSVRAWWPLDDEGAGAAPGPVEAGGWRRARGPEDITWLLFTSGTTGRAKGVPLTHANLSASVEAGHRGRPVRSGDVYLFPFPLCHVAGYNVVLQHRHGATVVLLERFDPAEVLRTIARERVTTMSLAPTMIARLVDEPTLVGADLSSLRSIGYGASAISADLLRRALDAFDCDLVQGYGMTELSGNAAFLDGEAHRRAVADRTDLLTAAGRPDPAVELRLGHDGEVLARGPQVFGGYWDDPAATARAFTDDGWFRTGDVGRFDADGFLHVVDRKKDLVVTGGENVASREVEDALADHPGVAGVAVIGLPDAEWGERVTAVVVPAAGHEIDHEALVAHVRARLAGFKCPRRVEVVGELPVNASGKVDKQALRARFGS